MIFHSDMALILDRINEVRSELQTLVISRSRPSGWPWYDDCAERWEELSANLIASLENAERSNEELRKSLYARSMSQLVARSHPKVHKKKPIPKVPPKVQKALDFIRQRGRVKGLLVAKHIEVSYPRFRSHYVPKLKVLGVMNDQQGDGYYFPESASQSPSIDGSS